jgi:hypothetical protein
MNTSYAEQERADREHLNLLSIFHFVVGGLHGLFASFFLFHVIFGILIASNPSWFAGKSTSPPPPAFMGYFMAAFGGVFVLCGWTLAAATFVSGWFLRWRKNRLFSLIVAGVNCALAPLGTVLGVFTIVVLSRESVKRLYEAQIPAAPS